MFDKAYLDFLHLSELSDRGVYWVSRAKQNMQYRLVERRKTGSHGRVLRDEIIELQSYNTLLFYPQQLRRVVALVEVQGKDVEMAFLTNQLEWSAWTVAELYCARWDINRRIYRDSGDRYGTATCFQKGVIMHVMIKTGT